MQITANHLFFNFSNDGTNSSIEYAQKTNRIVSSRNNILMQDESLKIITKEEKIIFKLVEIILLNNDPIKLLYLFLSEVSILFNNHSETVIQDSNKIVNNIKYLESVLFRIIIIIEKFIKMKELEKSNIDLYRITSILNNFYLQFSEIKSTYLNFYIKLIYLSITKTKLEMEFNVRKKFFSQFFEYIFDIVQNYKDYDKVIILPDDYMKLIEIIIIFLRNFSKSNVEDIYVVFKLTGIVIKKVFNQNIKNIFFTQLMMIYVLVAFISPLILMYFIFKIFYY